MTTYLCYAFFNAITRYETVNHDLVSLTDTMRSGEGLDVVVRIPIRIVNNDGVGRRKINT